MADALAQWLRLREPWDAASRSEHVTRALAAALPADSELRLLDLATGCGSNIRYLIPRLPGRQRWLAVDRSAHLLSELLSSTVEWAAARGYEARVDGRSCAISGAGLDCHIDTREMNLGALTDASVFEGRHLVTASALLDLVSARWLRDLAAHCRRARAAALFSITYDGRTTCAPREPDDEDVLELFNRHQLTDKGLGGPAAGPGAARAAAEAFADAGFTVVRASSDWNIDPSAHAMQRMLVEGWAGASTEIAPERAAAIADWRRRRMAHIDAGRSRLIVGHEDLAAYVEP